MVSTLPLVVNFIHGLLKTTKFQAVLIVIAVNLEYLDLQAQHLALLEFPGGAGQF